MDGALLLNLTPSSVRPHPIGQTAGATNPSIDTGG
jgi:hypothetical protein